MRGQVGFDRPLRGERDRRQANECEGVRNSGERDKRQATKCEEDNVNRENEPLATTIEAQRINARQMNTREQ